MSKNYSGPGSTLTFVAPDGGATAGVPLVLVDTVVIPIASGVAGDVLVGHLDGVWRLPADAALLQGQKVALQAGVLVDPLTATGDTVPFGKLMSAPAGGIAEALLIQ